MFGIAEEERDVLGLILWVDDFEKERPEIKVHQSCLWSMF